MRAAGFRRLGPAARWAERLSEMYPTSQSLIVVTVVCVRTVRGYHGRE
jgi:hypothetical protein